MIPTSRRGFLRAGLLAAGVWSSARLSAAAGRRKFTLAFTPGSIGVKADQREAIDYAHYFGFESVQPFGAELAKLSASEIRDLTAEARAKGLEWAAAGLPVDYRGDDMTFREGMRVLPEQSKALQTAGATRMGTWIRPMHATLGYLQNFRQTAVRLREIATVCEDHGLRFGLEYVGTPSLRFREPHAFVHTMAETKELIAAIGKPNVGFVLDSWHWWTSDETAEDILTLTNKDVVSADLNDAPAGIPKPEQQDNARELPLATGVIDVKAFLEALVQIGYDGPIRAEPFNARLRAMEPAEACQETIVAMKKAFALVE